MMRSLVDVGVPSASEAPACRTLLPEAFPPIGRVPELLVVRLAGQVVGAAAVAWTAGGFPVAVHVLEPCRRQGIGTALLDVVVGSVRGETAALRAWDLVASDSAAAAFLQASGFIATQRFLFFETGGTALRRALSGLFERVSGRVPATATLVALGDAPPGEVVALLGAAFPSIASHVGARIAPNAHGGYDPRLSQVLLVAGEVAGMILGHVDSDTLEVDVNLVAPRHRGGWANMVLIDAISRSGRDAGLARFRFGCEPHVRDTLGIARLAEAVGLPDRLSFELRL